MEFAPIGMIRGIGIEIDDPTKGIEDQTSVISDMGMETTVIDDPMIVIASGNFFLALLVQVDDLLFHLLPSTRSNLCNPPTLGRTT
jgi:hypothetical protein